MSFAQMLEEKSLNLMPDVGMGATMSIGSDRYPQTVIETKITKGALYVTVQEDRYQRLDSNGRSEEQEYEYFTNPHGIINTFRQSRDGQWQLVKLNPETGRYVKKGSSYYVSVGEREYYYDFSR